MSRNDLGGETGQPIRVMDLYAGEGKTTNAALAAGMEVVYAYEPVAHNRERYRADIGLPVHGELGPTSMMNAPEFDLLAVTLPAAASLSEGAVSQTLILARERQPEAIVVEGPSARTQGDGVVLRDLCRKLEQVGYHINYRPEIDDFAGSPKALRAVVVGTRGRFVLVWPDEVGFGGDDELEKVRAMPREGRPSPLLLALMAAMDRALRGPLTVEVWKP